MTTETIEQCASRIVRQEVLCCLSSLVSTLARGAEECADKDLNNLSEQASELAAPVPDYEEAAIQDGWKRHDDGTIWHPTKGPDYDSADSWQQACVWSEIDPYDREVYEHWSVSTWLAEKLQAAGEKVDTDFAAMNVWARTTTGQLYWPPERQRNLASSETIWSNAG